jgi:dihydroxy-acid dehydratase
LSLRTTRLRAARGCWPSADRRGHADGSALTISGKTLAEEAALAQETPGQQVIGTFEKPIKPNGGLVILKGNLAPEGCVMKIAAANRVEHRGPARVFDCEEDCFAAVQPGRSSRAMYW